jgi:hypothetical protein
MLDDEAWRFEDYACFLGCPQETYQFAQGLFSNENSFDRSFAELSGMVLGRRMQAIMAKLSPEARQRAASFDLADDPAIRCEPYGFARQALTPVSIKISQLDSTVLIDYEVWEARRTIHLDQPVSDGAPARLGYSAGRYDEGVLIVETGGISEDFVAAGLGAIHSTDLRTIERYSVSDDGEQLELEISFADPGVLTEPLTFRKAWRRTPDAEFLPWDCRLLDAP